MAESGKSSRLSKIYHGKICHAYQASYPRTLNLTLESAHRVHSLPTSFKFFDLLVGAMAPPRSEESKKFPDEKRKKTSGSKFEMFKILYDQLHHTNFLSVGFLEERRFPFKTWPLSRQGKIPQSAANCYQIPSKCQIIVE